MGIGVFVSQPLLRAKPENIFEDEFEETPIQYLLSRKDSIYTALKDIEFDYTTGKLSEEDYGALREKFTAEAADVLKEIDEAESAASRPAKRKKAAGSACAECGFKAQPGDHFCQSCGSRLA